MASRLAMIMAVVALLATACSSSVSPPSDPGTTGTTPTTLNATKSTASPSGATGQDFFDAMEVVEVFTSEWNAANLIWITAYADDSVSIDEYLRVSYETELQQRKLLVAFVLESKRFPRSMQDSIAALAENYRSRASAFSDIVAAEVAADDVAWRAATDEYHSHSAPEATLPIVEELLATPEFVAALAAEGIEYDDLVEALKLAFGAG